MKKLLILLVAFNLLIFPVLSQGVGINETGASPDASSILDVNSANKGLLIPRVALVSPTSPISSPATSLLVYNTSTTGLYPIPGFYYFNGTDWVMLSAPPTRTIVKNLTTAISTTVSTSSAGSVDIFNFNYTPLYDTILIQVNVAARLTAGSTQTVLQKWGFRLFINSVLQKIAYAHPNTNQNSGGTQTGDLVISFTLPIAVTPNISNNIRLNLAGLFSIAGTMTLTIDPSQTTQFANIIIYDQPTN